MILKKLTGGRQQGSPSLSPWARKAALTAALLALVVLVLLAALYAANWKRYDSAQDQIESRIARLDGTLAASADIDAKLAKARQSISPWLHTAGADSQNEILQRLRELVVSSGATLVSSQAAAVPAEADQALAHVKISATISGDWPQLVRIGQTLQAQRPPYLVRSLNLQREGQASGKTSQKARLTLQLDAPLAPSAEAKP